MLVENSVQSNKASKIIQEVTKDNSYSFYQPLLSSAYMRKKYYRKQFSFNQPIKLHFKNPDGTERSKFFYYMPISGTLEKLFKTPLLDRSLQTLVSGNQVSCRIFMMGQSTRRMSFSIKMLKGLRSFCLKMMPSRLQTQQVLRKANMRCRLCTCHWEMPLQNGVITVQTFS